MDEADEQRIEGRQWAEEVLASVAGMGGSYIQGFMRRMKREFATREIDPRAMTDEESREFGKSIVEFGKHAGKRYDDVPLDYWEWLADANSKVRRYLRSRRIAAEQVGDD